MPVSKSYHRRLPQAAGPSQQSTGQGCVHRLEGSTLEHRPFVPLPGYGSYLISPKKKSMKARFSTHRNTLEARGAPKVPVAAAEGCTWASWGQQDLSLPMVPAHGCFRLHHLRGCRSTQHRLSPHGGKARLSASREEACSPGNGKLLWEGRWRGVLCLVLFCFAE